ncbi:MAG: hypothetical protein ACXU86_10900 [Archangium sp.]
MKQSWMVVLLLLVLLVGCGTTARVVRLDTGQGKLLVHTPRGGHDSVKLREGEFQESMTELVRGVRPGSRPLRYARH